GTAQARAGWLHLRERGRHHLRIRGVPVVLAVDNSASGAVYKGIAIDSPTAGNFLYATNFHAGIVDVFDSHFSQVHVPGAFTDPTLPEGYPRSEERRVGKECRARWGPSP